MYKDIIIMIASHKACEVPADPVYQPVLVGSAAFRKRAEENAETGMPVGFLGDDTGDSISEKNARFGELTGLYWAWKNMSCKYLGLVHYRRYFASPGAAGMRPADKILKGEEAEKLLQRFQVILPRKRRYYIESVYSHYAHTFDGKQLDVARQIIGKRCPEYLDCFDVCMRRRSAYIFNMFLMPKALSDSYCEWLFPILSDLEQEISTEGMTDFEKRFVGRVSERLFNVWLLYQIRTGRIRKNDIKELPYLYIGSIDWKRKITAFLKAKFLHVKYDSSF